MAKIHSLGYPRIGSRRELKFALEKYWRGEGGRQDLLETARALRERHWRDQAVLDLVPVGDFSFYDLMLDTSFMLGAIPKRIPDSRGDRFDDYFRAARGRATPRDHAAPVAACEMTKWFDTNYHYLVPELSADLEFNLDDERIRAHWREARSLGVAAKPVIIGPLTWLYLAKSFDGTDRLALLPRILPLYVELLKRLQSWGASWVQIDEPALVLDLDHSWQDAYRTAYRQLGSVGPKLMLATYFDDPGEHLDLILKLPVACLHVDLTRGELDLNRVLDQLPAGLELSLGVIDGRNIWRTDLNAWLDRLEPISARLGERLWLAPSCSLMHVPYDLASESTLDSECRSWLAFARQKLAELQVLKRALNEGRASVQAELEAVAAALHARRHSARLHRSSVQKALAAWNPAQEHRSVPYPQRAAVQRKRFQLPLLPTTTIGSFPQTSEIRNLRLRLKKGELTQAAYEQALREEIKRCVDEQEALGLDVLVHGEAERNDMVEYFGELLDGYLFTQNGWVQSYGSRCVKPPIIVGDIERTAPMTVAWATYAQSLTRKPMKGMLTGPVTMLNWSFVRDDQPRELSCRQLALALRAEVLDLEAAGIGIIQIDEPALREGLPLKKARHKAYLDWAVACFRICAGGARADTQIHTHMCYSEFNDIIEQVAALDADVITIETARSAMELLEAFESFAYPNEIGPGVYDVHSPAVPEVNRMLVLLRRASERIPLERLWVNPDCGLKTRAWPETRASLANMVAAAKRMRGEHTEPQTERRAALSA